MAQKSSLPVAVGLDVGSAYVRCVVGLAEPDNDVPSIVGVGEAPSDGVRKGVVVDIEDTVSAITAALDEAERIAGINFNHATVGVNGTHILTVVSHGIIAIGSSNREISEADVARVEEAATIMQLPPNREIIQVFPRNYTIDGQEHIKDPVGMSGMRLEVDSSLITGGTPFIKNLSRSIHQAGFNINRFVANPLASADLLVTKEARENGCVLLDMGAMTTGMAVYEEGELLHIGVIPVGSWHVTSDLAVGLRTDLEVAEKIKLDNVDAHPQKKTKKTRNLRLKQLNGEDLIVTQKEVDSIAQARLDEIFKLVDNHLGKVKKDSVLPAGAILCGGGSALKNIDEYAKQALRLPTHLARPEGFSGIVDRIGHPGYSTAIGLMLEDMHSPQTAPGAIDAVTEAGKGFLRRLIQRLRK